MSDLEASVSLSRYCIRQIAENVRKMLKIKTVEFPVIKVLDLLTKMFSQNLYYIILPDAEFDKNVMAETIYEDSEQFCIRIRESVYNSAVKGHGPSLGFICHEICHFILIYLYKVYPIIYINKQGGFYLRRFNIGDLPRYKSIEWQTMALCGELMIPYTKCANFSFKQIIKITKSSYQQTNYFLNVVKKN